MLLKRVIVLFLLSILLSACFTKTCTLKGIANSPCVVLNGTVDFESDTLIAYRSNSNEIDSIIFLPESLDSEEEIGEEDFIICFPGKEGNTSIWLVKNGEKVAESETFSIDRTSDDCYDIETKTITLTF